MTFAEALEALRAALDELETVPDAELDPPTRRMRDNTRAMLDRYDGDRYDELLVDPRDRDELDRGLGEIDGGDDLDAGERLDGAIAEQYGRHPAE
jgi:hypothetical protein